MVERVGALLAGGDVVVDGGNSLYRDSIRRGKLLAERGIRFVDAGTSGGIWGLRVGFCLMVGGDREAVAVIEPALARAGPRGRLRARRPERRRALHEDGSQRHRVRDDAGLRRGLRPAQGYDEELDLHQIADLWQHGSVVRSWLLELAERALAADPALDRLQPYVEDSGEGRWTAIRRD